MAVDAVGISCSVQKNRLESELYDLFDRSENIRCVYRVYSKLSACDRISVTSPSSNAPRPPPSYNLQLLFFILFVPHFLHLLFFYMRPLILHTSALNDAEYDLYTSSLKDLAVVDDKPDNGLRDDSYYDSLSVGVREARAWLRGRYSSMDPHLIDSVCHLNICLSRCLDKRHFLSDPSLIQSVSRTIRCPQWWTIFCHAETCVSRPQWR